MILPLAVACSAAAPAEDDTAEAAVTGAAPQILVPVAGAEKAVATACAKELDATYCSDAAAHAATSKCLAKLGPDVKAACGASCLVAYSPQRAGVCHAGATYPTAAACDAPVADDCAFYRACVEHERPCGDQAYAIDFGERLCYAFVEKRGEFSARGQSWLRRIRTCLQTSIAPALHESLTCSALEDAAYAAHAPCYVEKDDSICHLPLGDVAEIAHILGTTLLSGRGLTQIRQVATACLLGGLGLGAPIAQHGTTRDVRREFFEGLSRAAGDEATLRAFLDAHR
jgi:hypothetical protein